ncbi:MAG TPA: APC family permease [Streptosporangiaceae bacterium]|nr:APC family permease [Streptosporangiaceae bacterium]
MSTDSPVAAPQGSSTPQQLERSAGLWRVVFQSVGVMGPGASIVFGLGLIISYAAGGSPLTMLLALLAAMCVAVAVGQLATRISGAGGLYSFTSSGLGPQVGFLVGWAYVLMTVVLPSVGSLLFAIVAQDFCTTYFHFTMAWEYPALFALLVTSLAAFRGVRVSTAVNVILGTVEVAILALVSVLLVIKAGSSNSLSFFDPGNAHAPGAGLAKSLFLGVVYSLATFVGFDSAAQLAEEARTPRRTVPRAVVLATAAIGIFYVFAMYTAVVAWPGHLSSYVTAPNPWREMAGRLGSAFAVLVALAILNSTFVLTQAGFNAATRLLYGMASAHTLPAPLARVHPRYRTPWVATAFALVVAIAGTLGASAKFGGPFNAFVYMITIVSLVFIAMYILTCLSCIVYFVRSRQHVRWLLQGALPVVGIVLLVPTLYYSGHGLSYPASDSLPTLGIWMGLGILALIAMIIARRDIGSEARRWLTADSQAVAEAELAAHPGQADGQADGTGTDMEGVR